MYVRNCFIIFEIFNCSVNLHFVCEREREGERILTVVSPFCNFLVHVFSKLFLEKRLDNKEVGQLKIYRYT